MTANRSPKEVAEAFFDYMGRGDVDGIAGLLHDDLVWTTFGGELFAMSGVRSKPEIVSSLKEISSHFPKGLHIKIMNVIQEGDRVAFEGLGEAVTAGGLTYNNVYHMQFWLKDGQIVGAREHMDTLYSQTVLVNGQEAPPAY